MFEDSAWPLSDPRTWAVILTGLLVVFCMLVVLILAIKLISLICNSFSKMGDGRKERKEAQKAEKAAAKAAAQQAADTAAPAQKPAAKATGSSDGNVIAAISAAVAMMLGHGNFTVKSVRKVSARRSSAWRNAGLADNTRPF